MSNGPRIMGYSILSLGLFLETIDLVAQTNGEQWACQSWPILGCMYLLFHATPMQKPTDLTPWRSTCGDCWRGCMKECVTEDVLHVHAWQGVFCPPLFMKLSLTGSNWAGHAQILSRGGRPCIQGGPESCGYESPYSPWLIFSYIHAVFCDKPQVPWSCTGFCREAAGTAAEEWKSAL